MDGGIKLKTRTLFKRLLCSKEFINLRLLISLFFMSEKKELAFDKYTFLVELGLKSENFGVFNGEWTGHGDTYTTISPSTLEKISIVHLGNSQDFEDCIKSMDAAKTVWSAVPPPKRGDVVRVLSSLLRSKQHALGSLVALEMGKILAEGIGEVQEAIDICDMAVGLSRFLNGSVIPSERPGHFMMERYNPLKKHAAFITVFFWNSALSLVCGNTQIWKGATSTSLCSIACSKILHEALTSCGFPATVSTLCQGKGPIIGDLLIKDPRIGLVSFTGSTEVGTGVAQACSLRFARSILELGGNNSLIVMDDANLKLAIRATLFSAVGTAGQRCTSLRRLMLHSKIYDSFVNDLKKAYGSIKVGNPLDKDTLCGPLHTKQSVLDYQKGIEKIIAQGGKVIYGGKVIKDNYVEPTLVEIDYNAQVVQEELFAPVLYILKIKDLDEAIRVNNMVPQGLSSSVFTTNQAAIFKWTGEFGSDCGIVNVNIGPSGAEIGGAFGGEKATGWGRESGSDSWKQYCHRSTCTINYSETLPLAQGIKFGE